MKKLSSIALAIIATTASAFAFADNGNGNGNGNGGNQTPSNPTLQATVLVNTAVINKAVGFNGKAQQNLASNVGTFASNVTETQLVMSKNSLIANSGMGGQANQNIASNVGEDGLRTATVQMAFIKDSAVINKASWGGKALQNVSSNSNCLTCQ